MVVSAVTREIGADNEILLQKNYLTTTELAKLCGVSRFTIRNWIKQRKIKAVRTVGRQYRIPVSEAISFLETLHLETSHKAKDAKSEKTVIEKKNFLYNFAYSVGRGVHVLKRKE